MRSEIFLKSYKFAYLNLSVHLALVFSMAGCSGCDSGALQGDGVDSADQNGLDPQNDSDGTLADGIEEEPPLPYVPVCGNGVLDEGEECDDRNRLNGDGCDWLCRLGDGDPPPEPDPDVSNYVPDGDPVMVYEGWLISSQWDRLPLVWTGSEFATAFFRNPGDETPSIIFRRFGEGGETLGSDWTYPGPTNYVGLDLVWTGSGFGLFYSDMSVGIYYLKLNPDGKPLGSPVLVEAEPQARLPAADLTSNGFILAWVTEGMEDMVWSWCTSNEMFENDTIRVRKVGWEGETEGDSVMIEDHAGAPADIVTGEGGFGINAVVSGYEGLTDCAVKFVKVSEDLSTKVESGYLDYGMGGGVVYADGRYITAWSHYDGTSITEFCIAHFTVDGLLERPPICNLAGEFAGDHTTPSCLAAGDGGLAILGLVNFYKTLLFLRTDFSGRAVAPSQEAMEGNLTQKQGYNIAWAEDGFGILFVASDQQMYFLRYRSAGG